MRWRSSKGDADHARHASAAAAPGAAAPPWATVGQAHHDVIIFVIVILILIVDAAVALRWAVDLVALAALAAVPLLLPPLHLPRLLPLLPVSTLGVALLPLLPPRGAFHGAAERRL